MVYENSVGYLRLDKTFIDSKDYPQDEFKLLQAIRYIDGKDITLIAAGGIIREVIGASKELLKHNISARVVSMHTLKPLDENEIQNAINETGGIVTIEENSIIGGLAGAVSEYCLENSLFPKNLNELVYLISSPQLLVHKII